jgi:DUF971 family protein
MTQLPTDIKLHKASKTLSLKYASGEEYTLPAEFLRVHSPSAEVQGHGNPILQFGKINVALTTETDIRRWSRQRLVHLGIPVRIGATL